MLMTYAQKKDFYTHLLYELLEASEITECNISFTFSLNDIYYYDIAINNSIVVKATLDSNYIGLAFTHFRIDVSICNPESFNLMINYLNEVSLYEN